MDVASRQRERTVWKASDHLGVGPVRRHTGSGGAALPIPRPVAKPDADQWVVEGRRFTALFAHAQAVVLVACFIQTRALLLATAQLAGGKAMR